MHVNLMVFYKDYFIRMLMSNLKGRKFSLVRQKSLSGEVFQ